jgi:glycopeptide antibiotics resistance protein
MNRHNTLPRFPIDRATLPGDKFVVIFSIILVIIATLYPFNFHVTHILSFKEIIDSFNNLSFFQDQVNNILLFMPLGFALASILQRKRINLIGQAILVMLFSALLSVSVEVLQIFVPSRMPTVADIVNNSIGGLVGFLCFYLGYSSGFTFTLVNLEKSQVRKYKSKVTLFLTGYILLAFLISIFWQSTTNFNSWIFDYPLVIGNERDGNRHWEGYISQLNITDRAISQQEVSQILNNPGSWKKIKTSLLADYDFTSKNKYLDKYPDKTGNLPELIWHAKTPSNQNENRVYLSEKNWLETKAPVSKLNQRISQTSEFSLSATIGTANAEQKGPARIISISGDATHRNFTLGQNGNNLDIRLRTQITGENGADIELAVPKIFTDAKPHNIIITYSRANLQVYVDNLQNFYSFNLLDLMPKQQKIFYSALSFIPLGICLAILTSLAKRQVIFYWSSLAFGILLPSLILEGVLIAEAGKNLSWKTLLISVLFTAGTMTIFRVRASLATHGQRM